MRSAETFVSRWRPRDSRRGKTKVNYPHFYYMCVKIQELIKLKMKLPGIYKCVEILCGIEWALFNKNRNLCHFRVKTWMNHWMSEYLFSLLCSDFKFIVHDSLYYMLLWSRFVLIVCRHWLHFLKVQMTCNWFCVLFSGRVQIVVSFIIRYCVRNATIFLYWIMEYMS